MRRFREMTTETAGFYNTVGFNDDTRAFLSIPARHDVARRVDCAFLARLVAEHRLEDWEAAELAHDLTYPEELGFDATRLKRLDSYVSRFVADGEFAGATALLARKGKIVQFNTYGRQAVGGAPMRRDTIFRIYSMTKPITGVAVLMLLEEGKLRLDDPISMHMPEFGKLKVITGWNDAGQPVLEDAKRPPTIRELMNHTAGYAYGLNAVTPVDKLYRANGALQAGSMDDFIARASWFDNPDNPA
jgi:CubicO group peptidase (beta-lactamase class C family)